MVFVWIASPFSWSYKWPKFEWTIVFASSAVYQNAAFLFTFYTQQNNNNKTSQTSLHKSVLQQDSVFPAITVSCQVSFEDID